MQNELTSLIASSTHPSLFAEVCRREIVTDFEGTVQMIREQLRDGRSLVIDMIGEQAVLIIEKMEV